MEPTPGHIAFGRVRQLEVKAGAQSVGRISVSAGVACYPEHGDDVEALLRAADAALYQAKHSGRDRVVRYEENAVAVTA